MTPTSSGVSSLDGYAHDLVPLAVSDPAISAASGLLGVIVGAVIGGLVQWNLERRREKVQAKTAARLLRMELSINVHRTDTAIGELHDLGELIAKAPGSSPTTRRQRHRAPHRVAQLSLLSRTGHPATALGKNAL